MMVEQPSTGVYTCLDIPSGGMRPLLGPWCRHYALMQVLAKLSWEREQNMQRDGDDVIP